MNEIERAISNINYGLRYEDCGKMVVITKFSACQAISALEKQIPKMAGCEICNDTSNSRYYKNSSYRFCPHCGQLLGDVEEVEGMKLKCDKTGKIVREMTDSEKAESIIKLINDYDINSTFLLGWQIEFIEKLCRKQLNNGWIPVSEKLPEPRSKSYGDKQQRVEVIACQRNGIVKEMLFEFSTQEFWETGDTNPISHWQEDNNGYDTDVIAWQPLPEPWKGV